MQRHWLAAIVALCFAHTVYANNETDIGRYMTVINKPSHAQVNLLSQTIQVRFPPNIQTIGDAMNYLLKFSGYSLVDKNKMNSDLKNTLSKPLPVIDRNFGPMSLKDGLMTLIGPAFALKADVLNRTIDFSLKSEFKRGKAL